MWNAASGSHRGRTLERRLSNVSGLKTPTQECSFCRFLYGCRFLSRQGISRQRTAEDTEPAEFLIEQTGSDTVAGSESDSPGHFRICSTGLRQSQKSHAPRSPEASARSGLRPQYSDQPPNLVSFRVKSTAGRITFEHHACSILSPVEANSLARNRLVPYQRSATVCTSGSFGNHGASSRDCR